MMNDNRPVPSPTYSHASGVESVASPFSHAQNAMLAGSTPVYHVPYTTNMQGSHSHLQPVPQPRFAQPPHPQQQQYYPAAGEGYDVFQTPHAQPSRQRLSPPYAESYQYEGAPHPSASLLTNSSLRTYDSTIPQYYPFTTDRTSWGQSSEVGRKRKRAPKEASPSGASTGAGAGNGTKAVKTPKRGKIPAEEAKGRARGSTQYLGEDGSGSRFQIPTPPSTGREATTVSLPVHLRIPEERESTANSTGPESVASDEPRRVLVTRHEAEGRKLAVGLAASSGSEEPLSPRGVRPERKTPVPALTTDDAGHAMLATDLVLQSELDWLENGGKLSPITSPEPVLLQTPIMPSHVIEEVADTPVTKERKTTQRLQAFVAPELPLRRADDLMVCTRLDQFGRVAVRKDLAIKFFGLDLDARGVVEEIRVEDEDQWVERSVASSSKVTIKPSWPDDVTPWSLAGGLRKERIQREETEKSNILRRYLEAASDESSDDEAPSTAVAAKGKGKSVSRLVSYTAPDAEPRRRAHRPTWDNTTADAKSALLTSMRHRALPVISPGVVACACGAPTAHGMGAMISCVSCKTWHHLMCNNIDEEAQLGGRWWCPACERQVSMSTPARSPGQGYAQSQERSSAFKGELTNIALAPSPMFNTAAFSHASTALRTPMTRNVSSPSRPHRSRILSYGTDMWAYTEDGPPGPTPSTPAPAHDRFSTPRIDDAPFDVTSTPSRHLDFNFGGGPSFFSLTPLGGRSRVTSSTLIADTPLTLRARMNGDSGSGMGMLGMGSRHDFLRDLGKESGAAAASATAIPGSPQEARWAHGLLGSQNLSPSPFGHRRSLSGNKMSSVRSSSRSGLGLGLPLERDGQDEE
jgi:hypothetical protein